MVQSIILTGPTAVGKSSLAIEVAKKCDLEIINADSVCFYREFNVGSAKPTLKEREEVVHHLIDVADPSETYHAGIFLRDVDRILKDIHSRNKRAIIVGGSGFYLKALRLGLWEAPETSPEFRTSVEAKTTAELFHSLETNDPEQAKKIASTDRYRIIRALEIFTLSGKKPSDLQAEMKSEPNKSYSLWVVDRDPAELSLRMHNRINAMMADGLVDEVKSIRERFPDSKMLSAIGYAQVLDYLDGKTPAGRKLKPGLAGLAEEIELSHGQLAKSQRTWFKNLQPNERFTLDSDRTSLIEKLMKFYQ
jgi:tRNA dimethylallyltransferase